MDVRQACRALGTAPRKRHGAEAYRLGQESDDQARKENE